MASWLRRKLRSLFRWGRRAGRRDDGRAGTSEKARPRQKPAKPMSNEKFIESCLRAHNDYRKHHGAAPLKHTKAISAVSQKWAEHLANTNTFEHSNNRKYKGGSLGENIAMKWTSAGGDYTGEEATSQWYNEINKYDFKRHAGGGTGHFTQVVWKGSQELGVGRAQGKDGKWIVVANYFPAGNVIGHHPENVFPPSGGKPAAAQSRPASGDKKKPTATPGVSGNAPTRIIVPAQPTGSRMANNSPQMHLTRVTTHTPPQRVSRVTTHTPELFPSFHVDTSSPFHSKTKVKTTVRTADMTSSDMTSSGGVTSYKKTTVVTETRVDGDGKKTLVKREVVSGDGDWPTGRSGSGLTGRMVVRTKVVRH